MHKIALLGFFLFVGLVSTAQENWCGTEHHWNKKYGSTEDWKDQLGEQMMRANSGSVSGDRSGPYIIPVVVHIIHNGSEGNISYEQVESAIQMLNEDYSRTNSDTAATRNTAMAPFKPLASAMNVEFRLAKLDPDGQCTNGVERRYSPSATMNANDAVKHWSSGGLDAWNRNNYLNIWVVESIESSGSGTTLGYAYFPYFGVDSDYGVLVRHDSFGTLGTASGGRTITHEVGHSLGLLHTFEGSCHSTDCSSNGDYCCDTPPVVDPQWSCSGSQNTCSDIPVGDHYGFDALDQFENYMSYSPCQNMFSKDQANIVDYNMTNISMFGTLTSAANLTNTGVGLPDVLCKADFSYDRDALCAGSSVQYTDMSYSNVTGWNWTFPGGTPSSSTDPDPLVTYSSPGVYSVTLQVTDGTDFVETTKTDLILVFSDPGDPLPYSEGFETLADVPDIDRFLVVNDDGGQTWSLYDGASSSGSKCVRIKNFSIGNGSSDELISTPIDLGGVDASDDIIFTFRYAYKRRSASNSEYLKFYVSKDCGETWALRKQLKGDVLGPEIQSSSYTPEDTTVWYDVLIDNINSTYFVSDFMYKFQFTNDHGNNIYIDDINLYPASMTGLMEQKADELSIFPNPTDNKFNIRMNVISAGSYRITLHNALGQQVSTLFEGLLPVGSTDLSYSFGSETQAGIYFIRMANENGEVKNARLIKL